MCTPKVKDAPVSALNNKFVDALKSVDGGAPKTPEKGILFSIACVNLTPSWLPIKKFL